MTRRKLGEECILLMKRFADATDKQEYEVRNEMDSVTGIGLFKTYSSW